MSKCVSVGEDGQPDGFEPPLAWRLESSPDGVTRLAVSPGPRPAELHRALISALQGPLAVLYVQLTDRRAGTQLSEPRRLISVEQSPARVLDVLDRCQTLIYEDGRHQLWIRGGFSEQLILDELGMIYVYPDDPQFRDVLTELGVPESTAQNMEDRDYVKVEFQASADPQEERLILELGMRPAG